jgi:hypothetical protein
MKIGLYAVDWRDFGIIQLEGEILDSPRRSKKAKFPRNFLSGWRICRHIPIRSASISPEISPLHFSFHFNREHQINCLYRIV